MFKSVIAPNGNTMWINPEHVVAISSLVDQAGMPIVGETGLKLVTGEALRVKGTPSELAAELGAKLYV